MDGSHSHPTPARGFTLVEAVLSIVVLSMIALVVAVMYSSGVRASDERSEDQLVYRILRSQMEALSATHYGALTGGSQSVTINGRSATMTWTLAPYDADGDSVADPNIQSLTVTLAQRSLTTLVCNPNGDLSML